MRRGFLMLALFVGGAALFTMLPERSTRTPTSTQSAPPLSPSLPPRAPTILATDPVRGHPNAPLTIIEYADFTCAACAALEADLTSLREEYGLQLLIVWKDAPLRAALTGARDLHIAARCAQQQGKFWEYHDVLLANPTAYRTPDARTALAGTLALNQTAFAQCLDDPRALRLVDAAAADVRRVGITATPTIFVNGKRLVEYPTRSAIVELLDER